MRCLSRCLAIVVPLVLVSGCGGDDAADTVTTTTAAVGATTTRTATGATAAATGKLPDACGLIADAAAGEAMAGSVASKEAPQPATDASSRCEWKGGGPYTLSLLIQRGTTAKSSFENTTSGGFTPATFAAGDARVRLGAHETSRDYRIVSFAAFNGTYYVYVTVQGRERADAAATDIAAGLVRTVLSKLPT